MRGCADGGEQRAIVARRVEEHLASQTVPVLTRVCADIHDARRLEVLMNAHPMRACAVAISSGIYGSQATVIVSRVEVAGQFKARKALK